MTLGTSLFLITVGAILKWAVTWHVAGVDLRVAGVILMIVGCLGLLLSLFLWDRGRTPPIPPEPL
jgi:hypothetical protein